MRALFLAGACLAVRLAAQGPLDPDSSPGFQYFYNLEYDEAIAAFEKDIAAHPDWPDLHNHLAQTLLFREMYLDGALESELVMGNNAFLRRPKLNPTAEVESRFLQELNTAMELCRKRIASDPRDARALYTLGISYGLRSNFYFLVKKAWHDSLRDATSSRKLHNRVTEIDPANVDARLVQGLHDYLVGSLPLMYRVLGFLVGFRGDKEQGIRTVQHVAEKGKYNRVDAEIFLCVLYRREGKPRLAVPLIQDLVARFPRNYLLLFELAQMHAALGEKENALGAVQRVAEMKKKGVRSLLDVPWEKIWFQRGTINFWYRDFPSAREDMLKVTAAAHEIDLNTGVLAWMRLGQIYDLTNQRQEAIEAYKKAIAYAPQADAARESRRYLSAPYRRDKT